MNLLAKKSDCCGARMRLRLLGFCFGLALGALANYPAMAAEPGVIELDSSGWMSLDHFDDKVQRFPKHFGKDADAPKDDAEAKQAVAEPPPAPPVEAKPAEPVMAQPSRPLNLAPLPGLNHGFDVNVSSTEDDKDDATFMKIENFQNKPDLHLSKTNWIDAAAAAKKAAQDSLGDDEDRPLDVRLATLPDRRITPIPAGSATKSNTPKAVAAKQTPVPAAQKPPEVAAACEALTAYKKRQLAAIESDRKTLAALQAAIADLGLGKKLDFMTDANSNLNVTAGNNNAPLMDMPATPITPPTAKN